MKLNELQGVKSYKDAELRQVLDSIVSSGDEELGQGSFSVTIKPKSGTGVIKFWVNDSSYEKFIDYIIAHPSKFFPKLLAKPKTITAFFKRPENFPDKIRYVRMEELKPMDDQINVDDLRDLLQELKMTHKSRWPKIYQRLDSEKGVLAADHQRFLKAVGGSEDSFLEFCHVMMDVMKALARGNYKLDLHEGNFMFRGSQAVIIDPIWNEYDHDEIEKLKDLLDLLHEHPDAVEFKTGTGR